MIQISTSYWANNLVTFPMCGGEKLRRLTDKAKTQQSLAELCEYIGIMDTVRNEPSKAFANLTNHHTIADVFERCPFFLHTDITRKEGRVREELYDLLYITVAVLFSWTCTSIHRIGQVVWARSLINWIAFNGVSALSAMPSAWFGKSRHALLFRFLASESNVSAVRAFFFF